MNKLTKLLSVFALAGAIGAGVAGVAGCKKPNKDHTDHSWTYSDIKDGTHDKKCSVGGETVDDEAHVWGTDNKCVCGKEKPADTPTPSDKLEVAANVTGLIIEDVGDKTVNLSTEKKSHDIAKASIKVYFATGADLTKGTEVPAANLELTLKDPSGANCTEWTGLKKNGAYTIYANLKNAKLASGSTFEEVSEITATETVTVNNAVVAGSLALKAGATTEQVAGVDTIKSTWTYEVTRANGDKEDVAVANVTVTGFDTMQAGDSKTANLSCTIEGATVTGTATYKIIADNSKVTQSYALNFGNLTDEQAAAIAAEQKLILQDGRFEVLSMAGGSIDNDKNSVGTKYFTKRLKCNGASEKTVDNPNYDASDDESPAKIGAPSYIKVHADGPATLTIYALNNGGALNDGNTRKVSVYKGVTFNTKTGILETSNATLVGEAKDIPSKTGENWQITITEAGDYYIIHSAAMTYRYVQLDQQVAAAGNEAVTLGGNKVYTKLSASHTQDDGDTKYKKTYAVGSVFEVDEGYTFKAESINDLTCEAGAEETITTGLTYWLGDVEITSGYTFTNADLGDKSVTVKLGGVSASINITVESAISGVTGITAQITGVNGAVTSNDATVELKTENIAVGVDGTNAAAQASFVSATYKAKGADGEGTAITEGGVNLAVGEYVITVVGNVAVGEGTPVEFTTTISFSVVNINNVQNVVINSTQVTALIPQGSTSVQLTAQTLLTEEGNANGTIFITAAGTDNPVDIDANNKSADGKSFTHRIKLGGEGATTYRSIGVEVKKGAKIVIYCMSSSGGATRTAQLMDHSGTAVGDTQSVGGSSLEKHEFTVTEADTYYFASTGGGINVYGIEIIYNS